MSKPPMTVTLHRIAGAQFFCENANGDTALIDGPVDIGGQGKGVRPMEMLLMSLAGCSAMDVTMILQKQRQTLEDLKIVVDGIRKDDVPSVYEDIHVQFEATGKIDDEKLARAVSLSMEKYCSVTRMLEPTVRIRTTTTNNGKIIGTTVQGGTHG